jgi:hypothetical protein
VKLGAVAWCQRNGLLAHTLRPSWPALGEVRSRPRKAPGHEQAPRETSPEDIERLARRNDPGYSEQTLLPSSSGPGRGPLKAETRVRFP